MQNNKHAKAATSVAVVATVAQVATHPVIDNAMRRLRARIAQVQALRAAKNGVRKQQAAQSAYMLAAQQLAAQYGLPAPTFAPQVAANARANSATIAPSREVIVINGVAYKPTKAVHAYCELYPHYTRKQLLQHCVDNGINVATASTQYGVHKAALAKAAAAEAATEE